MAALAELFPTDTTTLVAEAQVQRKNDTVMFKAVAIGRCCYISVPTDHPMLKNVSDETHVRLSVTGGCTFLSNGNNVHGAQSIGCRWVGWDYNRKGNENVTADEVIAEASAKMRQLVQVYERTRRRA